MTAARVAVIAALIAACSGAEHRPARDRYNEGLAALASKDYVAAEKALLAARDQARVDPELRYRAAFNLGLAHAAHADQLRAAQPPDPQGALDELRQSAGWFRDAIRLRGKDADSATALDRVLARARAISDELARGENGLEPRLDRLIDDQRGLRDDIERVWLEQDHGGAGQDPLAGQKRLTELADRERVILTEAGVVGDLAADEIDTIGKKADDERTDEQKVRVVQLQNLDIYLQEARNGLGNARRKLQELTPRPAHASAENALAALKRAREQLLDPIAALQGVAGDEIALYQETDYLVRARLAERDLARTEPPPVVPAWLTPDALALRQGALRDRVEEVRARLEAGVAGAAKQGSGDQQTGIVPDPAGAGSGSGSGSGPAPEQDPEQEKVIVQIKAALPAVIGASTAMDRARDALASGQVDAGLRAETDALIALGQAIEQFADLRKTIDLVHAEHQQVIAMLDGAAAKDAKPAERAKAVTDGIAKDLRRLGRIGELLGEESKKVEAEAAAAAAQAQTNPPPAGAPDPAAQAEAAKQRFALAEQLRTEITTQLLALQAALRGGKDPIAPARDAAEKIDALRELFFSVIEHLQQLIRDQSETRDRTTTARGLDEIARAPLLPELISRETEHAGIGQAIQDALAKQADAAAQAPPTGPQATQAADAAKNLAAAIEEVRLGVGEMTGARDQLAKAKDATNASYDLAPTVDSQAKAVEHLETALRLLQPPKQDQQQDQQNKDQQQDKDQNQGQDQQAAEDKAKQDKQDQDPSGALQRVRDDEARRQRERNERRREQPEPVDKDW